MMTTEEYIETKKQISTKLRTLQIAAISGELNSKERKDLILKLLKLRQNRPF